MTAPTTEARTRRIIFAMRWTGRVWGAAALLFWGAFFVEHLAWFADPRRLPPASVVGMQLLHAAMLAGLIAIWRWELGGGLLVVFSSVAFFGRVGGANWPWFALSAAVPGLLCVACGLHARTRRLVEPPLPPARKV